MRTCIAALKIFSFLLLCVIAVPVQMVLLFFHRGPKAYFIPQFFHRGVCLIFRIQIVQCGAPVSQKQTVFVSNHLSYLDIPVIGSVLRASFVAKQDVEDWPVFGFLSKLQQTAFISRDPTQASQGRNALENMVAEGKSLILFPEGTSTDGVEVLPFKSSLFAVATQGLTVQPFTLRVAFSDGRPVLTQNDRDLYAWHIKMDMPLPQHLWNFAKHTGAVISINFYTPLDSSAFEDRKTLAKACHEAVCNGLASMQTESDFKQGDAL